METRVRTKSKLPKKEITLMTLLACEATAPSRKLLKEHNLPDAKNYEDLENKLADLYFGYDDKIEIEKKLADIHPHKKWLEKHIEPKIIETPVDVRFEENQFGVDGIKKENTENSKYSNCCFSGADGINSNELVLQQINKNLKLIAIATIVGVSIYGISKLIK